MINQNPADLPSRDWTPKEWWRPPFNPLWLSRETGDMPLRGFLACLIGPARHASTR